MRTVLCSLVMLAATPVVPTPVFVLADGGRVTVDPARLGLTLADARGTFVLAAPGAASLVADLAAVPNGLTWRLPARKLAVQVMGHPEGLDVAFTAEGDAELAWPRTDPAATALALPLGGGLHVRSTDSFWRDRLAGEEAEVTGSLTFPAWSVEGGGRSVSYVLADEPRTVLAFEAVAGAGLTAEARRSFRARDRQPGYTVRIRVGPAHPLAAARAYRTWLTEQGRWVPFAAKVRMSPEAAKLLGATHAYVWGTGRKPALLAQLKALGVDRMWLGWDQDDVEDFHRVDAAFVAKARALGHLVGPYMTLDNVQDPKTADTPQSRFDQAMFRDGGIQDAKGGPLGGFAGRGKELSSEALRRASRDWIGERLAGATKTGATAPFLDCDAFGTLYEDHAPSHPMTPWEDRANRLGRLERLGLGAGLVLGSENGVGWAVPKLHFAHGAHAIPGSALWQLLGPKGKATFGSWGPAARPTIFFKEAVLSAAHLRALYDPAARIPLYQAAFHDALVTTDRWEFSPVKLRGVARQRQLLELLYLQPSIWNLDQQLLKDHGARLAAHHRFFAPLHRAYGTAALTDFSWLTADRLVQRATYAGGLVLTANLGATTQAGFAPYVLRAQRPGAPDQAFSPL